jgi:hypothetical protein
MRPASVYNDRAVRGAAHLPAIIDVHELVARIFHASADNCIRHFSNQFVAHIAAKLVPTVPPHRRRGRHSLRLRVGDLRRRDDEQ